MRVGPVAARGFVEGRSRLAVGLPEATAQGILLLLPERSVCAQLWTGCAETQDSQICSGMFHLGCGINICEDKAILPVAWCPVMLRDRHLSSQAFCWSWALYGCSI